MPLRFLVALAVLGCNRVRPVDQDGDGWLSNTDCDDRNPHINPQVDEVPGDGLNNDCDLSTYDDDHDQDGLRASEDCDDRDPAIPGPEVPYDGVDNDCDPFTLDDDLDDDGANADEDCDDDDPSVRPGLPEIPYDGIDNDCDPHTSDGDADGDGILADVDCDDTSAAVGTDPVPWYADCDQDGYAVLDAPTVVACRPSTSSCAGTGGWTTRAPIPAASGPGTVDCNDLNGQVRPGQLNWFALPSSGPGSGYDYDCDGEEVPQYEAYSCEVIDGTELCDVSPGFLNPPLVCGRLDAFSDDCRTLDDVCDAETDVFTEIRCH